MNRYDWNDGGMDLEADGEYVRYEDAAARIAELEAEVADWMKCARDNQEMLNTIGRQLGGQIPEQLVSEVAAERMTEISELIHPHDLAAYRAKKTLHK